MPKNTEEMPDVSEPIPYPETEEVEQDADVPLEDDE